jgi:hypothetical protein
LSFAYSLARIIGLQQLLPFLVHALLFMIPMKKVQTDKKASKQKIVQAVMDSILISFGIFRLVVVVI